MQAEGQLVQSIYYGRIGSEMTEMLLGRFGHDGSFLLRDSETVEGAYCLCVRKTPFVHNFRLIPTTDGWFIQEMAGEQRCFRSLEAMIKHYGKKRSSGFCVPRLTHPLDKTEIEYTSLGQDLLYMEICSSSYH